MVQDQTASPEAARRKSNLAFAFLSLDREQAWAMTVFYDYCRETDDIVDDPEVPVSERFRKLSQWREAIHQIEAGQTPHWEHARDLARVVRLFQVPVRHLHEILDALSLDLEPRRYETVDDLRRYCYGVASAVGLVCIRIFGCRHPDAPAFAEELGYALQFTNILRDVVEDYHEYGRIYLPRDEMAAYGVEPAMLAAPDEHPQCQRLFRLCYFRARHHFNAAHRLLPPSDREKCKAALVMGAFYEEILETLRKRDFKLGNLPYQLPKWRKLTLFGSVIAQLAKAPPRKARAGRVAVLGGGIAGMSAATALAREGYSVDLYEARNFPGGRAHSLRDNASGLNLDNGQHIMMGCYRAFLTLAEMLGVAGRLDPQDRLRVTYAYPGDGRSTMEAWSLPAPAHMLGALLNFPEIIWEDRASIVRLGAMVRGGVRPAPHLTATEWLEENAQTPGTMRALWRPFCVAALNEEPEEASARLLFETLRRSLFGTAEDSRILFSKVGLGELFFPEINWYLRATRGDFHLGKRITEIGFDGNRVTGLRLRDGEWIEPDLVVSAMPWTALAPLLPEGHKLRHRLTRLKPSPIFNLHLHTDRRLFQEPFVGFLDSPLHWVFDRSQQLPPHSNGDALYAITVSAADDWMALNQEQSVQRVRHELESHFPAAQEMEIRRALVIKTRDATFRATPEAEFLRPGPVTPWENLFLAGDWTATGLPGTLESAAESGLRIPAAIDRRLG